MAKKKQETAVAEETEISPSIPEDVAIRFDGITKVFNKTLVANDNINLDIRKGEIHALLGENGAGKSTLMSILFGLIEPTEGTIYVNGRKSTIKSPNEATALGIGMVHQHFMLVDVFTGLENIILGNEDTKWGFVRYKKSRRKVEMLMDKYGLKVDLDMKIKDMTVSMQQKVEILKMLYRDSNILIFDEPTAVLTAAEIDDLMEIILNLKAEGKTIVFISHKLNEVRRIADRVSILRKGALIETLVTSQTTNEQLAELMVGKHVSFTVEKGEAHPGENLLEVKNLCVKDPETKKMAVDDISFNVRKGEIISILGVDGNGQNELVNAITGLQKAKSGQIIVNGKDITNLSIKKKNKAGVSHIPADRHEYGLVLDYNIMYNVVTEMVSNSEFSTAGFMKDGEIKNYSDELVSKYDIRSSMGSYTITRTMSGGNQQKVIVARELERDTDLLIAVQPTRGLDVGAIENIHKMLVKYRDQGKAILLVSLEIDEVFDLADTIYTIYEGRLTGRFDPKKTSYQEIGLYMTGARCMDEFRKGEDHE